MSRCAFFASAPTVRFLQSLAQLRLLSERQQRKIAATVYGHIKQYIASPDVDALCGAAREVQDERWRLISAGVADMADVQFACIVLAEQWLVAQAELARSARPIAEVLAEKRCDAIEAFIRDNLCFENGEVIELRAPASLRRSDHGSKTAA